MIVSNLNFLNKKKLTIIRPFHMIRRPVTTRHLNRILKKFGIEHQNSPQTPLNLPTLPYNKPMSIWFQI